MAIVTYKIELRVDYNDPTKDAVIQEAMVEFAKQAISTAAIISDSGKTYIKVVKVPFFGAQQEIPVIREDSGEVSNG